MASLGNTVQLSDSALPTTAIHRQQQPPIQPLSTRQDPNQFIFQGDEAGFLQEMHRMGQAEIDMIQQCSIGIIGEEIKPGNINCLILTLLTGICLFFPLFFFCCQWWKRAVSQIFQIREQTYRQINKILKGKSVRNVNIKIYDNFFTEEKIKVLARGLNKKTKISKFELINQAGAFDMNNGEYSNFLINAKPFLKLSLKEYYIAWYKQYLKSK